MSQVVACPNCQTRYNLPESAIGKRVKCKSCGKPFSASVGASRAKQRQAATAARGSGVDVAELEKMGIGKIKAQPEIFAAEIAPGPDPLQNHVVHDPGFSLASTSGNASGKAATVAENDFAKVVENPHLKGIGGTSKSVSEEVAERRRREEKILKAYATPSSGTAPKRKKKSSQVGITRLWYFLCNFGLFAFVVGMTMIGTFFAGIKLEDTSPNPLEAGMMLMVMSLTLMVVMGLVSTLLVRSRVENMAFLFARLGECRHRDKLCTLRSLRFGDCQRICFRPPGDRFSLVGWVACLSSLVRWLLLHCPSAQFWPNNDSRRCFLHLDWHYRPKLPFQCG